MGRLALAKRTFVSWSVVSVVLDPGPEVRAERGASAAVKVSLRKALYPKHPKPVAVVSNQLFYAASVGRTGAEPQLIMPQSPSRIAARMIRTED